MLPRVEQQLRVVPRELRNHLVVVRRGGVRATVVLHAMVFADRGLYVLTMRAVAPFRHPIEDGNGHQTSASRELGQHADDVEKGAERLIRRLAEAVELQVQRVVALELFVILVSI